MGRTDCRPFQMVSNSSCLSNERTRIMKGLSIWFVSVSPTSLASSLIPSKSKLRRRGAHIQTHSYGTIVAAGLPEDSVLNAVDA